MTATTTAQFAQTPMYYAVDFDGSMTQRPMPLDSHVTGDKYDETIQFFSQSILITMLVGLVIPVLDGQSITITFAPDTAYQRY